MAPHPPPCTANEVLWGTLCYPRPNTLTITNLGGAFSFTMGKVSSDLLPQLAHSAGDDAHMVVKKSAMLSMSRLDRCPPKTLRTC